MKWIFRRKTPYAGEWEWIHRYDQFTLAYKAPIGDYPRAIDTLARLGVSLAEP